MARFLATPEDTDGPSPEELDALTPREREMVALVATGLSNPEIAEQMFLSPFTVRAHVQRAMTKLGAGTGRNWWSSPTAPAWSAAAGPRPTRPPRS